MTTTKTFSAEELEKLLDSHNINTVDKSDDMSIDTQMLSEEFIKKFACIMFTDGSCIGKRQGTKFGGSGIYIHSTNNDKSYNKYNSINIFEKLPQEKIIYINSNSANDSVILYSGDTNKEDFIYRCSEDNCNKVAYSYKSINKSISNIVCGDHKLEESIIFSKYTLFHPTNIRAEGNAILIALRTIKYIIQQKIEGNKKNSVKGLVNYLNSSISNSLNDFDYNEVFIAELSKDKNEVDIIKDEFLIVSDSKFWLDLITVWIRGWVQKRTIMERKNSDIILEILDTYNYITLNNYVVKFKHIRGHQDSKKENGEPVELNFYHKGNILADKLATHASQSKDNKITVII